MLQRTVAAGLVLLGASLSSAQPIASELFAAGFTEPLFVTHAPDDLERIFVLERPGLITAVDLATRTSRGSRWTRRRDGRQGRGGRPRR